MHLKLSSLCPAPFALPRTRLESSWTPNICSACRDLPDNSDTVYSDSCHSCCKPCGLVFNEKHKIHMQSKETHKDKTQTDTFQELFFQHGLSPAGCRAKPSMLVHSLSPAPGILCSSLHTSMDEGNTEARTASSERKTGIILLQDKADIEYCSVPRVLVFAVAVGNVTSIPSWSSPCLSDCEQPRMLRSVPDPALPGRACEVCSEHRQHWDCFPLSTQSKGTQFGEREESVSTKQPLSCQAVAELKRGCLQ